MQTATDIATSSGNLHDDGYGALLERLGRRFHDLIEGGKAPLFTTDAEGLWDAYLEGFPAELRQYHDCSACRHFIERFGALVTIDEAGAATPVLWAVEDADDLHRPSFAMMSKLVRRAKVTGVFLAAAETWGQPATGIWTHFYLRPPASMVFRRRTRTAGQAMAEKREDFKNVSVALDEFGEALLAQALTLLRADSLYRSEKVLGPAEWLHALHVTRSAAHAAARRNILWRAVALAPAGFCHPRSSMVGTLLADIASGMSFDIASRRFAEKMHPLRYQRPQAAPKAGAIVEAEKLVEQLGVGPSLERRFCRLDEVKAVWRPTAPAETPKPGGGVFGHLTPKGAETPRPMTAPPVDITWEKLARTVLPSAKAIALLTPRARASYGALTTAVHPDAPPILQWDREDTRNPVAWYVWHGGSLPEEFGLRSGEFHPLAAIALQPPMWGDGEAHPHQGKGVALIVEGAKETKQAGNALFPECIKAELHGIRAVLEAYSRRAELAGLDEPHAAGLLLGGGKNWGAVLRVRSDIGSTDYRLDRWD